MWLDDTKYALINTGFRGHNTGSLGVLSGYASFIPQSRYMHFRLVADFKLVVGVNLFL